MPAPWSAGCRNGRNGPWGTRADRWRRAAPRRAGRTGSRSTRRGFHGVERLVRVEVDRAAQELSLPELPDVGDMKLERLARLALAEDPRDQDHALVPDIGDALDLGVPAVTEGAFDLLQVAADAGMAAVGAARRRGGGAELDLGIGDGDQRLGIEALESLIRATDGFDARAHARANLTPAARPLPPPWRGPGRRRCTSSRRPAGRRGGASPREGR